MDTQENISKDIESTDTLCCQSNGVCQPLDVSGVCEGVIDESLYCQSSGSTAVCQPCGTSGESVCCDISGVFQPSEVCDISGVCQPSEVCDISGVCQPSRSGVTIEDVPEIYQYVTKEGLPTIGALIQQNDCVIGNVEGGTNVHGPVGIVGQEGYVQEETNVPGSKEAGKEEEGVTGPKGQKSVTEHSDREEKINQDEVKQEVQKAIDGILKNPGQISDIVNGLKGDKNVLKQVLDFLQKNPQIKRQAMDRAMGHTPTMQELSRMPKAKRDEIMKKAKEARKELAALNPTNSRAVLINVSRVAKDYHVGAEFPSGSKFCDGTVEKLPNGLNYVYIPEEKRINKRATQIVGQPTCGEIVLFRLDDNDEDLIDFTLEEFNSLYPRPKVGATPVASSSSSSSSSSFSKSRNRRR